MPKRNSGLEIRDRSFFLSSFHSCVLFKGLKRGIADHVFILQASSVAVASSTPRVIRNCASKVCFS